MNVFQMMCVTREAVCCIYSNTGQVFCFATGTEKMTEGQFNYNWGNSLEPKQIFS